MIMPKTKGIFKTKKKFLKKYRFFLINAASALHYNKAKGDVI